MTIRMILFYLIAIIVTVILFQVNMILGTITLLLIPLTAYRVAAMLSRASDEDPLEKKLRELGDSDNFDLEDLEYSRSVSSVIKDAVKNIIPQQSQTRRGANRQSETAKPDQPPGGVVDKREEREVDDLLTPPEPQPVPAPAPAPEPSGSPEDSPEEVTDTKEAPKMSVDNETEEDSDDDYGEYMTDKSAAEEEEEEERSEGPAGEQQDQTYFSAYYARESAAQTQFGLYVYAHLLAAVDSMQADVTEHAGSLGGVIPKPKMAQRAKLLAEGTPITVMPEAETLEFNPVAVTKRWELPFTRFDFIYEAPESLIGEIVTGRISISVGGVEIAHIPFATLIEAKPLELNFETLPKNPLAAAKFASGDTTQIYDNIFISYSRKDKRVAENYRLAQLALGHDIFMDTYSIRTGEDWQAALANAIDQADIFQLFWSEHSAASENVRDEWDYALKYKCEEDQCRGFIRPVYWEKPLPSVPPELGHLNFRFVPFEE